MGVTFFPDSTGLLGNLRYFKVVCLYLRWLKSFNCPHFSRMPIEKASVFPGPLSTGEHQDSGSCRVKAGGHLTLSSAAWRVIQRRKSGLFLERHSRISRHTMKGQRHKLQQGKFGLNIRKKSFTVRAVKDWHRLPREAVGSPSLEMFKFQLVGPWAACCNFEVSLVLSWVISRGPL